LSLIEASTVFFSTTDDDEEEIKVTMKSFKVFASNFVEEKKP
jgi:hypothetical protein